ncbi:MAG: hypothetical protein D6689_18925 [Deltaproteobacteria bacterium]|nr:MAG: hypothetical protein D6689_18925 [Deltaproteobacteria bacterium]
MRALMCLVAATAGCAGYTAGSFRGSAGPMEGQRRTVGCLDVAVAHAFDPAAVGPVARIAIANRCDRAVRVDLGAIRAVGRGPGNRAVMLVPYDPRGEIRPAAIEARTTAVEWIEYQPPGGRPDLFTQWCLDLAAIDAARPSDRPVRVCFAHGGAA